MLSERAQKLVDQQRLQYIDGLPNKAKKIGRFMQAMKKAGGTEKAEPLEQLFQQLHRLAGSAGSYGFDSLGHAASVADRYLYKNSTETSDLRELSIIVTAVLREINLITNPTGS